MASNKNIPFDLDREEEEDLIRQMEENDVVHEEIRPTPPTVGTGIGTASSQSSSVAGSNAQAKCGKTTTSAAWNFFDVQWEVGSDGKKMKKAKCKFCAKILTANPNAGTRHLLAHGQNCAKKYAGERNPMQSQLQFQKDGSVSTWTYDPIRAREALAKLIASTDLPINFGDNVYFEKYIQEAHNPQFKRVTRNTTRSDILNVYNKARISLKSQITSANFCIALTSDIWSGRAQEDYLSVVAHYVDSNWVLQKRIIGFKLVDSGHTASIICERILSVTKDYEIENRIISITLDNAAANTKAIEELEKLVSSYTGGILLHQRCACHIINLIVKSGMKRIDQYIDKVRSAIAWINGSNSRIREFKQYCKAEGLKPRKFGLDMPVRWNSTYLMLKNTIAYKNAITVFYNLKMGYTELTELDWYIVEKFIQFLETFYDATVLLSGVYYPTAPLVILTLTEISQLFFACKDDNLFKEIVQFMVKKVQKILV